LSNYWNEVLHGRMNRRRALGFTGGTALGAAFLAACGGGSSGGSGASSAETQSTAKKDKSGLVTQPDDTSKSAKAGGVFKWSNTVAQKLTRIRSIGEGSFKLQVKHFNLVPYG